MMMNTNTDILGFESDALQRFTEARRQGQSLPPEVESLFDSIGIWWDEISQEYFSMQQVYTDSISDLLATHGPEPEPEN
jgi:hypothetical protein